MDTRPRHLAIALAALLAVICAACTGTDDRDESRRDGPPDSQPTTTGATTTSAVDAGCTPPGTLTEGELQLTVEGVQRSYLLALPDALDPTRPTPVILNFHGSGSDMNQQAAYSRLAQMGTERGYIVVTPDGTGTPKGWSLAGGADDTFVAQLLDTLEAGACVDRDRVFAAGISNGSAYSALLACRAPHLLAAVAMVAATTPAPCPEQVRPSVIAFAGTADPVVPYDGGAVQSEGARGLAAPAAEPSIAAWAAHDGCDPTPTDEVIDDVTVRTWSGCDDSEVSFYRIDGGGHTWPGPIDVASLGLDRLGATTSTVDATALMLDLFDRTGSS
jgi:polyhydroxybutyrate depolymerase